MSLQAHPLTYISFNAKDSLSNSKSHTDRIFTPFVANTIIALKPPCPIVFKQSKEPPMDFQASASKLRTCHINSTYKLQVRGVRYRLYALFFTIAQNCTIVSSDIIRQRKAFYKNIAHNYRYVISKEFFYIIRQNKTKIKSTINTIMLFYNYWQVV